MRRTFHPLNLSTVESLLCDADGTLFDSEREAFRASAVVTTAFLAAMGVPARPSAEELRRSTTGLTFRSTAVALCCTYGVAVEDGLLGDGANAPPRSGERPGPPLTHEVLERWVAEERRQVSAHLATVLRPDAEVGGVLTQLARHLTLAAVTSSARVRLDACLTASALADLFPPAHRFSAEDSLPEPRSKPDPAVYVLAGDRLGCRPGGGVAVEDSVAGVESAVAAGFPTIGMVAYVPTAERPERVDHLRRAGVSAVVASWTELRDLLLPAVGRRALAG